MSVPLRQHPVSGIVVGIVFTLAGFFAHKLMPSDFMGYVLLVFGPLIFLYSLYLFIKMKR